MKRMKMNYSRREREIERERGGGRERVEGRRRKKRN